jgi:hypothetical protein
VTDWKGMPGSVLILLRAPLWSLSSVDATPDYRSRCQPEVIDLAAVRIPIIVSIDRKGKRFLIIGIIKIQRCIAGS